MSKREDVVNIAKSMLGIREGSREHEDLINEYNNIRPLPVGYKIKKTDSWCAAFVSVVGVRAGMEADIMPECGCQRMIELYKKKGTWKDKHYTAKPGDIIFYDWGKNNFSDHVGIVTSREGNMLTVIEGNKSDEVSYRAIRADDASIIGYGAPEYDEESFLDKIKGDAVKGWEKYRILPSLTIAQAILESGNGKSTLAAKYNNIFGMKKGTGWAGKTVTLPTKEWNGREYVTVNAEFRVYDSLTESIDDHAKIFVKYPRYKGVLGETNYKKACKKVQLAGYATDPVYADSLISLIERERLYLYDNTAKNKEDDGYVIDGKFPVGDVYYGEKSEKIRFLQQMLIARGCPCGKAGADGELGADTLKAIYLYKKKNDLPLFTKIDWEDIISKS